MRQREGKMERWKEKEKWKQPSVEQMVQKKNWFTCNLLNIIENSSLVWKARNKDIGNYMPVSCTIKTEVADWVSFPVVVFEGGFLFLPA